MEFKLYLKSDKNVCEGTQFVKEVMFFLQSNKVIINKVYLESDMNDWIIKIYVTLSYKGTRSDQKKEKKILIHYLQEYLKILNEDNNDRDEKIKNIKNINDPKNLRDEKKIQCLLSSNLKQTPQTIYRIMEEMQSPDMMNRNISIETMK